VARFLHRARDDHQEATMGDVPDRFKDPEAPQPVMQPGLIDGEEAPDREIDDGVEAPVLDPATRKPRYEPRPLR
jgi:hypothetical protein